MSEMQTVDSIVVATMQEFDIKGEVHENCNLLCKKMHEIAKDDGLVLLEQFCPCHKIVHDNKEAYNKNQGL